MTGDIIKMVYKYWQNIIIGVEITSDYPGYKFKYAKTLDELNTWLVEQFGEDVFEQSWYKNWLRYERREQKEQNATSRQTRLTNYSIYTDLDGNVIALGDTSTDNSNRKNNYEYLAKKFIQKGITSVSELKHAIESHPVYFPDGHGEPYYYRTNPVHLIKYIRKYASPEDQSKIKEIDRSVVLSKLEEYAQLNMSLRSMAAQLKKDIGISISFKYIQMLLKGLS